MNALSHVIPILPHAWARAQRIVVRKDGDEPQLVISSHTPGWALAEAARQTGIAGWHEVEDKQMDTLLAATYAEAGSAAEVVGAAESEVNLERLMQDMPAVTDLLDAQDDAPVIRMINALLTQAARDGASDVHFEAFETHSVVRYRVDGTLRDVVSPRKALHAALISAMMFVAGVATLNLSNIFVRFLPRAGRDVRSCPFSGSLGRAACSPAIAPAGKSSFTRSCASRGSAMAVSFQATRS